MVTKAASSHQKSRSPTPSEDASEEQHHPRLAVPDFGPGAGKERPATPQVHGRAHDRRYPGCPRSVDGVVEPLLDLVREDQHRDREYQIPPEEPAEDVWVMAGVLVVGVVSMVGFVVPPTGRVFLEVMVFGRRHGLHLRSEVGGFGSIAQNYTL